MKKVLHRMLLGLALGCSMEAGAQPDPNASFDVGLSDRASWQQWFNAQQGDFRVGAYYWFEQRRLPHPEPCINAANSQAWQDGCVAAQRRLALSDARRRSEPDYKRGWNSFTAAAPSTISGLIAKAAPPIGQSDASTTAVVPATPQRAPESAAPPLQAEMPGQSTVPISPMTSSSLPRPPAQPGSKHDQTAGVVQDAFDLERRFLSGGTGGPEVFTAYNRCIVPKIQNGPYSSYDDGKSAVAIVSECSKESAALTDACSGGPNQSPSDGSDNCKFLGLFLTQAALKIMGK